MTLLLISFLAGVLTVLAPCVLPLLPVIIGSSLGARSRATPYIVVASLAISIILFTYLLKASSVFIMVPQEFWTYLSGGILALFGLTLLFPSLWEKLPGLTKMSIGSNKLVGSGYQKKSFIGDILVGAALGPVFSTCSPTYFVILASVLPVSFALGTVYLLAYILGLSIVLLSIALLGQRFTDRLAKLSDPHGAFKRGLGAFFLLLGVLIAVGYEKKIETVILNSGFFDVTGIEQRLLEGAQKKASAVPGGAVTSSEVVQDAAARMRAKALVYPSAPEITNPSGFVNTGSKPITIGEFKGKKVVLIDFWTYSCINCQRTLPYLKAWYDKYHDQGLEIISIHTPEFAFEKVQANVENAVYNTFGLKYPVVLDNDYGTWGAFSNQFWPRKYLIDIDGYIVYDHAGEGNYDVTEKAIQKALGERAMLLGTSTMPESITVPENVVAPEAGGVGSPETYFGAARNEYLANGRRGVVGVQTLASPASAGLNALYLTGRWSITPEYAESGEGGTSIIYTYKARDVYFVASSVRGTVLKLFVDGKPVGEMAGADVAQDGTAYIKENRLYHLLHGSDYGTHTLKIEVEGPGLDAYTFTFG